MFWTKNLNLICVADLRVLSCSFIVGFYSPFVVEFQWWEDCIGEGRCTFYHWRLEFLDTWERTILVDTCCHKSRFISDLVICWVLYDRFSNKTPDSCDVRLFYRWSRGFRLCWSQSYSILVNNVTRPSSLCLVQIMILCHVFIILFLSLLCSHSRLHSPDLKFEARNMLPMYLC